MAYSNEIVEKAALLHDIGKVLLRAKPGKGTHEVRGIEFLSPYVGDTVEEQALLRAIGHHHQTALKELQPPIDDLSYLT